MRIQPVAVLKDGDAAEFVRFRGEISGMLAIAVRPLMELSRRNLETDGSVVLVSSTVGPIEAWEMIGDCADNAVEAASRQKAKGIRDRRSDREGMALLQELGVSRSPAARPNCWRRQYAPVNWDPSLVRAPVIARNP